MYKPNQKLCDNCKVSLKRSFQTSKNMTVLTENSKAIQAGQRTNKSG